MRKNLLLNVFLISLLIEVKDIIVTWETFHYPLEDLDQILRDKFRFFSDLDKFFRVSKFLIESLVYRGRYYVKYFLFQVWFPIFP